MDTESLKNLERTQVIEAIKPLEGFTRQVVTALPEAIDVAEVKSTMFNYNGQVLPALFYSCEYSRQSVESGEAARLWAQRLYDLNKTNKVLATVGPLASAMRVGSDKYVVASYLVRDGITDVQG